MCHNSGDETCNCDSSVKIPAVWRAYITDQRGPRVLQGILSMRALSLRAATAKVRQTQEAMDMATIGQVQAGGAAEGAEEGG